MKKTERDRKISAEKVGGGLWLAEYRKRKKLSQRAMAKQLNSPQSVVAAWETGRSSPSDRKLIELGNILGYPECLQVWERAGIDIAKLQYEADIASKGTVSVPLIDIASPANRTYDVPQAIVPKLEHVVCARIAAPVPLFPFSNGSLVVVDKSNSDCWELVVSGSLAAVQFDRFPEVLGLSAGEEDVRRWSRQRIETVELRLSDAGNENTNAEELERRWRPENGMIRLEAIYAGWICLERASDPGFTILGDQADWAILSGDDPWRLVLRGAQIRGVSTASAGIPLSRWETSARWTDHPSLGLEHIRILGKVLAWIRHDQNHSRDGVENLKSRKERKK